MHKFLLIFPENDIQHWANRNKGDLSAFEQIGRDAKKRGYLKKLEFLKICEEKSPRTKPRCKNNSDDLIQEVTRVAFAASSEQLRIQILTLFDGVAWPTASFILHFCSDDPYPVLDFRALWSLRAKQPTTYNFSFWWSYTEYCRALAKHNRVSMRTLDSALWQYSKENQASPKK